MKFAFTILLTLFFHLSNSEFNYALKLFSKNNKEPIVQNSNINSPPLNLLSNIIQHSYNNLLFVDRIPPQYIDYVTFNIDLNATFTAQDSLYISGQNLLNTPIFINGEEPVTERKGRFKKLVSLNKFGKNIIYVSFISPDMKIITQRTTIYRLKTPHDIKTLKFAKNYYQKLVNADLLYDSFNLNLNSAITRADIAYFIYQLKFPVDLSETSLFFDDVPIDHWANDAIRYVTEKRIMGEFPDGTFRPEQQMIKLELLLTLVRGLGLEVNYNNTTSEFLDIDSKHWVNKFINAALDYGMINLNQKTFNLEQKIFLKDFIEMTNDLVVVNDRIQSYFNTQLNHENVESEEVGILLSPVYEYLKGLYTVEPFFTINYPENYGTVYSTSVTVNGKIYPERTFSIDDNLITTNIRGEFEFVQNLQYGNNSFLIQAMGTTVNYELTSLKKYFDLDNHWVSDVASKMRFINNMDDDDLFYPDKLLTLTDFVNFSEWLTVSTSNTFNEQIDFLTSNHIISANNGLDFDHLLSRIDALVWIMKLVNLETGDVISTQNNLNPFWDISADYWALPYLHQGISLNIIAPSTKFFPDRAVTKAEFYTMLSRTPTVSRKIKQYFYD